MSERVWDYWDYVEGVDPEGRDNDEDETVDEDETMDEWADRSYERALQTLNGTSLGQYESNHHIPMSCRHAAYL